MENLEKLTPFIKAQSALKLAESILEDLNEINNQKTKLEDKVNNVTLILTDIVTTNLPPELQTLAPAKLSK